MGAALISVLWALLLTSVLWALLLTSVLWALRFFLTNNAEKFKAFPELFTSLPMEEGICFLASPLWVLLGFGFPMFRSNILLTKKNTLFLKY